MGFMSATATRLTPDQWAALDARVKRADEDRWLSSRYADAQGRRRLVALYAFSLELARIRLAVKEPGLAAIRFQWWREGVEALAAGRLRSDHDALTALCLTRFSPFADRLLHLVDGYEAALSDADRALDPEDELMRLAADCLAPTAWAAFGRVAGAFAAARRGEATPGPGETARIPVPIRPALAHASLWRLYVRTPEPAPILKRFQVFRTVLTGEL